MWSTFSALRTQISEITREAVSESLDILKEGSTEVAEALKDANLSPQEIEKIHMERKIISLENDIGELKNKLQMSTVMVTRYETERKEISQKLQKSLSENEELHDKVVRMESHLSEALSIQHTVKAEKQEMNQTYQYICESLHISPEERALGDIEVTRWSHLVKSIQDGLNPPSFASKSRGLIDLPAQIMQDSTNTDTSPKENFGQDNVLIERGIGPDLYANADALESLNKELDLEKSKIIELESKIKTEWSSLYYELSILFSEANQDSFHYNLSHNRETILDLVKRNWQKIDTKVNIADEVDDTHASLVKKFISEFMSRNQLKLRTLSLKQHEWVNHFAHITEFVDNMRKKMVQLEDDSVRIIQKMQQLDLERARLTDENTELEEEVRKGRLTIKSELESIEKERRLLKQKEAQWQQILEGIQGDLSQQKSDRMRLKDEIIKNEDMTAKVSNLTNQCKQLQLALETTARIRQAQFNEEIEEFRKKLESSEQERNKLQERISEVEQLRQNENQRKDAIIQKLETGIQGESNKSKLSTEKLTQMVSKVDAENRSLKAELLKTKEELDALVKTNSRLESIAAQFQSNLEAQIDSKLALVKQQLNSWKEKYTEKEKELLLLATRYSDYDEMKQANNLLKITSASREEELKSIRTEVSKLRKGLEDALAQLAAASRRDENLIDRRLVNQLIVSYFEVGSKKNEVLDIMSKILKFSEEEKIKVGLVARPGSWYAFITHTLQYSPDDNSAGSLADLWVDYLKKEAESNGGS